MISTPRGSRDIDVGSRVAYSGTSHDNKRGTVQRIYVLSGMAWVVVLWDGSERPQLADPEVLIPEAEAAPFTSPAPEKKP